MVQQFFHQIAQRASEVIIHVSFARMLDDHRAHALETHVYQMASLAEKRFLRRDWFFLISRRTQRRTHPHIRSCLVRFLKKKEHEAHTVGVVRFYPFSRNEQITKVTLSAAKGS